MRAVCHNTNAAQPASDAYARTRPYLGMDSQRLAMEKQDICQQPNFLLKIIAVFIKLYWTVFPPLSHQSYEKYVFGNDETVPLAIHTAPLHIQGLAQNAAVDIEIRDVTGRSVWRARQDPPRFGNATLRPTTAMPPGIYMLRICQGGVHHTGRLIVQ